MGNVHSNVTNFAREEAVDDVIRFIRAKQKASSITMTVGQSLHVLKPAFLIEFANAVKRLGTGKVATLTWYFSDNVAVSVSFNTEDVVLKDPKPSGGFGTAEITLDCANCVVHDGPKRIRSSWEGTITIKLWNTMKLLPSELGEIFQ